MSPVVAQDCAFLGKSESQGHSCHVDLVCVCLSSSREMRRGDLRGPQLRVSHLAEQSMMPLLWILLGKVAAVAHM